MKKIPKEYELAMSPILLIIAVFSLSILLLWLSNTDKEKEYIVAITGSLFGGLIAFFIARWQYHKEWRINQARNERLLKSVIKEVAIEVRDNRDRLKKLESSLEDKNLKDKLTWGYAFAIIQGLRVGSYELFIHNGMTMYANPKDLEVLYGCYSIQDGVMALVREVHAMSEYNLSETERMEVERLGKNIVTYSRTAISKFESNKTNAFLKRHLP